MLAMIYYGYGQSDATVYVLMLGLILFGVVFAVNPSLHSYLIISLSGKKEQPWMWTFNIRQMRQDDCLVRSSLGFLINWVVLY